MSVDVAIIGGGPIGTSIAWRCAQRGLTVAVADPDPLRGAWHTAAGMLAPVTELHYAESALLRLNLDSLRRWPGFSAELSAASGRSTGYLECGTLQVAWDAADLAALRDLQEFGRTLGLTAQLLTGREARRLEPALAAGLPGGLLAEDDHQVDPRALHAALREAARRCGVAVHPASARIEVRAGTATGLLLEDGSRLAAGTVVLAAGAWSGTDLGLPADAVPPVRPVKGQTLRLRLPADTRPARVIRGAVKGSPIYLVPRANDEIVVGASSEEGGFNTAARAGAVYELLRDAQCLVPELGEAELAEVCTGLRPGTADNAPLLGPSALPGLVLATGHYRNGILLTPVTADAITEFIANGHVPAAIRPFAPARFTPAVSA